MTHAWLFPGQGSQYPQMGRFIWREKPAAAVLSLAESVSGLPLRRVIENGPDALLRNPEYLEPAIFALQAAHVLLLQSKGMHPSAVAGYSLGELGALYCAGCLSLEDALAIASARGKILARHARGGAWLTRAVSFPDPPLTVLPPDSTGVFLAAYNTPRDFTVTGEASAVGALETLLLKRGATLSPVAIDGPWHSPLAAAAAEEIAGLLRSVEFLPPRVPLCLATSGAFETEIDALRSSLSLQIERPILWTNALETLWSHGVRSTLEIGPGRVLTSFVRVAWAQREYRAQFLDRQGGRPIDFAALQPAFENREDTWTKTA